MAYTPLQLKQLGIVLRSSKVLEEAYQRMRAVPTLTLTGARMLLLDLDSLPTYPIPFKEIFIRWALQANEKRILQGDEPLFPLDLIKRCPLWQAIKMPLISLELTKTGVFNRPAVKTVGKLPQVGSINKGKR